MQKFQNVVSVLGLLACILLPSVLCRAAKLGCDRETLEKCSASLFFFASGPHIPVAAEDLAETCKSDENDIKCLQDYIKNCLNGVSKGMVQLMFDGITAVTQEKCTVGHPQHSNYLKYVVCMNTIGPKIHLCNRNITAVLETSSEVAEQKHKIGYACCTFGTYQQCVKDSIRGSCSDEHIEYAEGIVNQYAGDILDAVCSKYRPGGEGCKSLPVIDPVQKPKTKSLLPPLSDIFKTFG
ncbi:uncharacterized protein LOC119459285 [Dermacentor silvarum]|uniref:uncharacterized protein LOC119459285 n=1 Tax=Dermacentor silvarum TaxID=543639 RepID=UPI0021008C33|nr:uncharacterized protein LOC119459285 [Dermacentor silvarum]